MSFYLLDVFSILLFALFTVGYFGSNSFTEAKHCEEQTPTGRRNRTSRFCVSNVSCEFLSMEVTVRWSAPEENHNIESYNVYIRDKSHKNKFTKKRVNGSKTSHDRFSLDVQLSTTYDIRIVLSVEPGSLKFRRFVFYTECVSKDLDQYNMTTSKDPVSHMITTTDPVLQDHMTTTGDHTSHHHITRTRDSSSYHHMITTGDPMSHDHMTMTGDPKSHDHTTTARDPKSHDHMATTGVPISHDHMTTTENPMLHEYMTTTRMSTSHDHMTTLGDSIERVSIPEEGLISICFVSLLLVVMVVGFIIWMQKHKRKSKTITLRTSAVTNYDYAGTSPQAVTLAIHASTGMKNDYSYCRVEQTNATFRKEEGEVPQSFGIADRNGYEYDHITITDSSDTYNHTTLTRMSVSGNYNSEYDHLNAIY